MAESLLLQMKAPEKRAALVADAENVLNQEVSDKSGLSGIAIKTAFKVIKGIRPGFIKDVIDGLLNEFLERVDPLYQKSVSQGLAPGALLAPEKSALAAALLGVTDAKAQRANSELVKKTYEKLRPAAQKHVEAAAPRLGELLNRHAAAN